MSAVLPEGTRVRVLAGTWAGYAGTVTGVDGGDRAVRLADLRDRTPQWVDITDLEPVDPGVPDADCWPRALRFGDCGHVPPCDPDRARAVAEASARD